MGHGSSQGCVKNACQVGHGFSRAGQADADQGVGADVEGGGRGPDTEWLCGVRHRAWEGVAQG